jgi:hypothetical protein
MLLLSSIFIPRSLPSSPHFHHIADRKLAKEEDSGLPLLSDVVMSVVGADSTNDKLV